MKKNLLYLLMLICSMGVFSACSDDDDVKFPIDKEIAGTYKGTLDVVLNGTNIGAGLPKNISITKASNNSINMELKDFQFMGMNLGTIIISNCILTENGGTYTFVGSQTLTSLPTEIGECPAEVKGTIVDGKATVNLDINVVKLQQIVKVTYKGAKLSGSESAEAKINDFTIESDVITEQPVIDETAGKITFKVNEEATAEELNLTPVFTISEKAIVSPASGVAQDFSDGKSVVYTVVAENGTVKEYAVSVAASQSVLKFSFEEWENVPSSFIANEYDKPKPTSILATSSEGAAMLKLFGFTNMPTYKTDDKKEGNTAIKLVTMDTSAKANALVPAITSGSVFTGKFDMDFLNEGKLYCTRFGILYDKKPMRFKGWYKYTPGTKFIDGTDTSNIVEVPNKVDECAIQAVLYEITKEDDVLTGFDINNSEKRVAVAVLTDGTAKEEYTYFDLPFTFLEGKLYNPDAKYKLAIVCSSSKEGDFFKGAGGSTLILDELEVIGE